MNMQNNTLLNEVIEARNGHYCHCVEVEQVCELESIADAILEQNEDKHGFETCLEFLETLEVICTDEENEDEVYAFDFFEYFRSCYTSNFSSN